VSIATTALTKRYGDTVALTEVVIEVPTGSVYGLVGPNGAGKTTLLGILARLRHPTSGTVRVGGARVAVLPDTPRFDRWLTGREVVDLSRTLADPVPADSATEEVIAAAGLTEAAHRKVGGYSRGMLQRLGLAAAVVGDPDVLLLDEPAAALDPAGRREVLDLITAIRGKATVLFSSHILDDVQEVCDRVGILRRGELVHQGTLDDLLRSRAVASYTVVVRSDAAEAADALRGAPWVTNATAEGDSTIRLGVSSHEAAEVGLVPLLAALGRPIVSLAPNYETLEQVFLEMTR
jgi:ABC-2 type transport system ATP-binding protein